jgi:cysteine-rich repeat protein
MFLIQKEGDGRGTGDQESLERDLVIEAMKEGGVMKKTSILASIMALAVLAFVVSMAEGYALYSQDIGATGNCAGCHGAFSGGAYTSFSDGTALAENLHNGHRLTMLGGDCNVCHFGTGTMGWQVRLESSAGGRGLEAIACVGCHGRNDDMTANSDRGAGLRQHHWNSRITVCVNCHDDADPANYTPVGEDVPPSYYFTPDGAHPAKPTDPCDGDGTESVFGTTGLDNDGDGLNDGSDPDCAAAVCGNGMVDTGEDCDDGNTADGDCCSANCMFEAARGSCDNLNACDGVDECDGAGNCVTVGPPLDCDDGNVCTDDSCDPTTGCVNAA